MSIFQCPGVCGTRALTHTHSLPIQLYLVDTFTYSASALAAASVRLSTFELRREPWMTGVPSGVPLVSWVCFPSIWRTDVRQAGLWRWELVACGTCDCHWHSISHMDLLLWRTHPRTKFAEQLTISCCRCAKAITMEASDSEGMVFTDYWASSRRIFT